MEILLLTNSPAEGKILAHALGMNGHAVIWRTSLSAIQRELEEKIWTIDIAIYRIGSQNTSEAIKFADYISELRMRRGYHHKPHIMLISDRSDKVLFDAATLAGASLWVLRDSLQDLITQLDFIRDQDLLKEQWRPCLRIHHGFHGRVNLNCDDEEALLGISVQRFGSEYPTEQTKMTAVLTDFLCRQRYPKTEQEIAEGISRNPFYMAQLSGRAPEARALKRLIQRCRERLEPALRASQSPGTAWTLIKNVPGHTRMYKFDGLAKIVHHQMS